MRADLLLNTSRHCKQIKQESKNHETYRMSKCGETCLNAGRTPGMYSCVQYMCTSASLRIDKLKKLVKLIKQVQMIKLVIMRLRSLPGSEGTKSQS